MIKLYILKDGSIIFKGKEKIFCPTRKFLLEEIIHSYFEVSAVENSVNIVDEKVGKIISKFPFSKDSLDNLAIALSEAVNNAVSNGKISEDRKIGIDIKYIPKVMLYIAIRDDLGPLNIDSINLEISDSNETDESGRGFQIMTELVTIVAYYPDDSSTFKDIILGLEPDDI